MKKNRIRQLAGVLIVLFLMILGRLFSMQVVTGSEYEILAWRRTHGTVHIPPRRGTIRDRTGRPLAINEPGYDLMVVPSELTGGSLQKVARVLGLQDEDLVEPLAAVARRITREIEREVARHRSETGREPGGALRRRIERHHRNSSWLLLPNIEDEAAWLTIYVDSDRWPGISIRARAVRRYPQGETLVHVVGHMSRIFAEEYEVRRRQGYFGNDLVGRSGIESIEESRLRGRRGLKILRREIESNGNKEVLYREEALPGEDIDLTIDLDLQRLAEEALDEALVDARKRARREGFEMPEGASAVVLDVETGAVHCLATSPRYDPTRTRTDYAALLEAEGRPLFHRPVAPPRVPPPGSVFKIVTAIAGIEEGATGDEERHFCRGYLHRPDRFRCWNRSGHGSLDLVESIERSCDIFFYREGEELEPEVLAEWARRFGFGMRTGIEVDRELPGLVPDPTWKRARFGEAWYAGDRRMMAIGQSFLEVTPLQVARFMAAVATGWLVRPRLVRDAESRSESLGVSPRAWRIVREGMRRVVEGSHGTARLAGLRRSRAAVKTGTAEVGGRMGDHAWIAGYAPREAPRLAFAVLIENSGHGGVVAGPVAARILEAALARLEGEERG